MIILNKGTPIQLWSDDLTPSSLHIIETMATKTIKFEETEIERYAYIPHLYRYERPYPIYENKRIWGISWR